MRPRGEEASSLCWKMLDVNAGQPVRVSNRRKPGPLFHSAVSAFVVRNPISGKFVFRAQFDVDLMPFGCAVCNHALCLNDRLVGKNVSISDCLPDSPNDTRKVFQIVSCKDTAAGHFRKILQVMRPAPFCGTDVFLLRKLEGKIVQGRLFLLRAWKRVWFLLSASEDFR